MESKTSISDSVIHLDMFEYDKLWNASAFSEINTFKIKKPKRHLYHLCSYNRTGNCIIFSLKNTPVLSPQKLPVPKNIYFC